MKNKIPPILIVIFIAAIIILVLIKSLTFFYVKNIMEETNAEMFANSTAGKGVDACNETCEFFIAWERTNNSEIAKCHCRPSESHSREFYLNVTSGEILE